MCVWCAGGRRHIPVVGTVAGRLVNADVRAFPARDHVRPQGAPTRRRARLQRPVRPAHQPLQRDDLPLRLVLARTRRPSHHSVASHVDHQV